MRLWGQRGVNKGSCAQRPFTTELHQEKETHCRNGHAEHTHGSNLQENPLPLRKERLARQRGWGKLVSDGTALRGKIICGRSHDPVERVWALETDILHQLPTDCVTSSEGLK